MEFIRGRTLHREFRERGPFDAAALADVGIQIAHALGAVHDAGLVHRDVKAQNIMRDENGRVMLGDFGAGRAFDHEVESHRLAGTPLYLAPELFDGNPPTPASNLYALGILLFHVATGNFPVSGLTVLEIRDAHAHGGRSRLRDSRPDLPAALSDAIDRAIEGDPAHRFKTGGDMAAALALWSSTGWDAAAGATSLLLRSRSVAIVVVAMLLGVGGTALVWQHRQNANAGTQSSATAAPAWWLRAVRAMRIASPPAPQTSIGASTIPPGRITWPPNGRRSLPA